MVLLLSFDQINRKYIIIIFKCFSLNSISFFFLLMEFLYFVWFFFFICWFLFCLYSCLLYVHKIGCIVYMLVFHYSLESYTYMRECIFWCEECGLFFLTYFWMFFFSFSFLKLNEGSICVYFKNLHYTFIYLSRKPLNLLSFF